MPYAKLVKGGSVSFNHNGKMITAHPGFVGDVPQRILDKYKKQGRFEPLQVPAISEPALRSKVVTGDMKRGEVLTRLPDAGGDQQTQPPAGEGQSVPKGKYIHRHRGGAKKWAVTVTATGEVVTEGGAPLEGLSKEDAIAKAIDLNGAEGGK